MLSVQFPLHRNIVASPYLKLIANKNYKFRKRTNFEKYVRNNLQIPVELIQQYLNNVSYFFYKEEKEVTHKGSTQSNTLKLT